MSCNKLTRNTKAKVSNTISDCNWYFARLAWFYFNSNFECGNLTLRFYKIEKYLERRYETRDGWPAGMLQVWLERRWCVDVLNGTAPILGHQHYSQERHINTVLNRIWDFLHQFDTQLLQHDNTRKFDQRFTYDVLRPG